jgi:hypothetical protein
MLKKITSLTNKRKAANVAVFSTADCRRATISYAEVFSASSAASHKTLPLGLHIEKPELLIVGGASVCAVFLLWIDLN